MKVLDIKKNYHPEVVKGVTPLADNVIVTDMSFEERKMSSGIILLSDDGKNSGIRPRWAKIFAVGPEQRDPELVPGKWLLISHGRWTRGIDVEVDGVRHTLRKVDLEEILAVADEPVSDDTMSDKVI
jgi:co-chaperonin GroES (HSP10)